MGRPPRLSVPGVALHIVQRGVDRQACFRGDSDYLVYLSFLARLSARTNCAIHAYCLMTNHVHLLLTPIDADACATLMRELGQRYVPYFNRRYGRTGTLWEGRFRSCLVESASYVLACYRYIELNPVRAAMVATPLTYRWSSHTANAGARDDALITGHAEYDALGADTAARHAAYRGLFDTSDEPSFLTAVRDATNGGYALVSDALKAELSLGGTRHIVRGKPGRKPAHDNGAAAGSGDLLP